MARIIFILTFALFLACTDSSSTLENDHQLPYDLNDPTQSFELPGQLREISGLSYAGEGILAAVQDEIGSIFLYDTELQQLVREIEFGSKGDYEGITIVENDAYVVKSDGEIFFIKDFWDSTFTTEKYSTVLSDNNNVEGLFYDKDKDILLLACKGDPGTGEKGEKAIYGFSLQEKKLTDRPEFLIDLESIQQALSEGKWWDIAYEVTQIIDVNSSAEIFQPSGLAIHPVTDEIYVISAKNSLLLVMSKQGWLLSVFPINRYLLPQPEGIAFDTEGNMFIASEGKGRSGIGKIVKYLYHG